MVNGGKQNYHLFLTGGKLGSSTVNYYYATVGSQDICLHIHPAIARISDIFHHCANARQWVQSVTQMEMCPVYSPMLTLLHSSTCWLSAAGYGGGRHMAAGQTMPRSLQAPA